MDSIFGNLKIKTKLILGMIVILMLSIVTLSGVFIKQSERLLIEALENKTNLLKRNFSIVSARGIQESSFSNLQALINEVALKDNEIRTLFVAYPNGMIIATSDKKIYRQFSKIQNENILSQVKTKQDRIFRNKDKKLLESVSLIFGNPTNSGEDKADGEESDDKTPKISVTPKEPAAPKEPIGFIYIELDTAPLENSILTLWRYSMMITFGLLIAGIFAAYGFGATVSKPIKALAEDVRIIASGNLKKSIRSDCTDEIGQLVSDVEKMRLAIKDLTDNLEAKVAERTRQLQEATDHLADANNEISALNERLKAENLRLGAELDVARRLQQMILPGADELKCIDGLDIVGFMQPSDEVGGDYYDVLRDNGTVKISIGDVTGHGLESGVLMLMTQTAVRTLLMCGEADPVRFLSILNRVIFDNVVRMKGDKNLTLAMLDYQPGQIKLSGQHEQMIVVRKGGKTELVDTIDLGFPIGLEHDIDNFVNEKIVLLQPGDGVVLYSDGITEAENEEGKFYGLERLCQVLSLKWDGNPAEKIKKAVIEDVRLHIGEQKVYDDLTLVVLKQK